MLIVLLQGVVLMQVDKIALSMTEMHQIQVLLQQHVSARSGCIELLSNLQLETFHACQRHSINAQMLTSDEGLQLAEKQEEEQRIKKQKKNKMAWQ